MEPVSAIVSAIFKVLQEIARAQRAARRNRARCRDLAQRADVVSGVVRDATAGARADAAATRRKILCRLREALDDALKLVESCAERDGRPFAWFFRLLESRSRANKFDDVDKKINNCLAELSAASGASIEKKIDRLAVSARQDNHPRANKQKEAKAGNAPQNGATGNGGKGGGGKRRRGKKKAAAANNNPPPPPPLAHGAGVPFRPSYASCRHHSVQEDPDSCSVM